MIAPAPHAEDVILVRPPHRHEGLMRAALRFVGAGLLALGVMLGVVSARLTGGDVVIALAFCLTLLGGGWAALWWMKHSGGVRRVEVRADRVVVHRAGFAGVVRRVTIDRAAVTDLELRSVGEGRAARWRIRLATPDGRLDLGGLIRSGDGPPAGGAGRAAPPPRD